MIKIILIGAAVIGVLFGFYKLIDNSGDWNIAQKEEAIWCLDNGGRKVKIDGIYECFKLTEVADSLISSEFLGARRSSKCKKRSDAVWIKTRGGEHNCFHFERLVREVK